MLTKSWLQLQHVFPFCKNQTNRLSTSSSTSSSLKTVAPRAQTNAGARVMGPFLASARQELQKGNTQNKTNQKPRRKKQVKALLFLAVPFNSWHLDGWHRSCLDMNDQLKCCWPGSEYSQHPLNSLWQTLPCCENGSAWMSWTQTEIFLDRFPRCVSSKLHHGWQAASERDSSVQTRLWGYIYYL